jgi:tRNA splicing endonuclease
MSETQKKAPVEFKTSGTLTDKGVIISEQSSIDQLSSRGYGTLEGKTFTLAFFEALYLQDKGMLETKTADNATVDFQQLLHCYEAKNENAWVNYLVYRDLRSRAMWFVRASVQVLISVFMSVALTAKTLRLT